MAAVLAERCGLLYVKETTTDFFFPRTITHWWPTAVQWWQFRQLFADEERARAMIGKPLSPLDARPTTVYHLDLGLGGGLRLALRDGGRTTPDYTDLAPVEEPKQRGGKKLPVRWKNGRWEKYTQTRGWVPA